MNQKELKELIEFLIEKDIAEFELERGDVKVRIKRGVEHVAPTASAAPHFAVHMAPSTPAPEGCIHVSSASAFRAERCARSGGGSGIAHGAFAQLSGHSTSVLRRDRHPL